MKLSSQDFGKTKTGQLVTQFTLANRLSMRVDILNYGGIIRALWVADRSGQLADVVLGFDSLDEYLAGHPYFGALVGRFANRLAGASFELDGVRYQLAHNDGANHLHGGEGGFDKVVWKGWAFQNEQKVGVLLHHRSPDGEDLYPGTLDVEVMYSLNDTNELWIDYRATPDAPTIVNLTNHSYFNLAGQGTVLDHVATIYADAFTPVDSSLIPTGVLQDVTGTPLDFRRPTAIGARIDADDEQLRLGAGYDHNFVLHADKGANASGKLAGHRGRVLRLAARVSEPTSGRILEVLTSQPGMQFYTGNMMLPAMTGKGGQVYPHRGGFCLETQHFPDSPNQPNFPSVVLRPGQAYNQTTVFRFLSG